MYNQILIATEIMPLSLLNTGKEAMSLMTEFRVAHLPIVEDGICLGIVSEEMILNMTDDNNTLRSIKKLFESSAITMEKNVFEIIKTFHKKKLSLIPILENGKYIGSITSKSIIAALASISAIQDDGGVLILKMPSKDYLMSEIAQIVEGNNLKILSFYIVENPESEMMSVTLKLNRNDLAPVVQTFERYNYNVMEFTTNADDSDSLNERYQSLMRYLNL